ncbi:hypothetical protein AHF37_01421 [Paragonimus kellicotti]|nr:hypothetical protein AHF37_01421 [Paragonimus kellicotti]
MSVMTPQYFLQRLPPKVNLIVYLQVPGSRLPRILMVVIYKNSLVLRTLMDLLPWTCLLYERTKTKAPSNANFSSSTCPSVFLPKANGELGFKAMCSTIGWAQNPMINRIDQLDPSVPITFIFGSRSWMDSACGTKTKALRPNSYVDIKIIEGAGHQVYAQAADDFNAYVSSIADRTDSGDQFLPSGDNRSSGPVDRSPQKIYPSSIKPSRLQTFFFHTDPGGPNSSQSSQPSDTSSHDETSDEASLWS